MITITEIKNYNDIKNELNIALIRLKAINDKEESLDSEKEILENLISKLNQYLKEIEINLKKLSGIEYKLYYEIIVNGLNVTKAIEKVSIYEDKDSSTLWKTYYPKIKEKIKSSSTFPVPKDIP